MDEYDKGYADGIVVGIYYGVIGTCVVFGGILLVGWVAL